MAKKSVDRAVARAASLGHAYAGVEHLLLGIAAERSAASSRLLAERGATLDRLGEAVSQALGMS
ncbi:MAG: Clp protease N-terminal domain-containing protein [Gemmatimonadales bacterium]